MKALIDYHHTDLAESLHRLLEDRLGYEVYIPFGMDWFDERVWNFGRAHAGDHLAKQFLMDEREVDDLQPHRKLRRITLSEARAQDWDLVVATVADNQHGYHRFAAEQGARYAVQVGNVNQWVERSLNPLILDATGVWGGVHFTPEFDIEGAFHYEPPGDARLVRSFVNLFPGLPCFGLYLSTMEHLTDWQGRVHGHNSPNGFIKPTSAIGDLMRQAAFIWHDKVTGDGFGYVIHYAAAVGRPLIGHASHYAGQVAGDLWEDGVTCIDLDLHSPAETARLMDEIVDDPARHEEMCFNIAQRVRERIDFEGDAQRVADALGLLVTV